MMVHELTRPAAPIASQELGGKGVCLPTGSGVPQPCLNELLGTVAHELRTPLAATLSGVWMIASECDLDPVARLALSGMERQLRQALRLVDDLFDVCAGSLRKLSLCKEGVALAEVVEGATEATAHLLAARRHRLMVSLPPEPVYLEADPQRMTQILTNLLSNAAKYTDPGGQIRLTVEAEAGQLVLRVRDNGRGIAPDLLPGVFDLFRQGTDCDHARGGLGIGLALVKSLVELHEGSVAAYSAGAGAGAEFVVRLPRRGRGQCGPARADFQSGG
jgi:signal transduction histidine kinase